MTSSKKIPEDAFAFYVALGPDRSYDAVARKYAVTKRAVVKHARRANWVERLAAIEVETRRMTDQKLADELHSINVQHSKLLRAMASRVATGLSNFQLNSAMEAMRGAEIVIKLQRLIAGAPSENTALSIERVTRDELARLVTTEPEDDDDWDTDESDAAR
ncbi:MAG: hypothetical protein JNN27_03530 [Planctomycetes bacterium]|nr:hypothetical protein [Planctomycetota bacterium]